MQKDVAKHVMVIYKPLDYLTIQLENKIHLVNRKYLQIIRKKMKITYYQISLAINSSLY